MYGVGLASSEFHGSLEISNFLDSFDDSTSAVIAREILDVEASTFSKVLLRDKKIFGNYALARTEKQLEELKSTPIEEYMPSEEEVKKLTEEIDKLEKIKDYNPIDEWRKCLEVYSELKGVPQLLLSFDRFYEPFKRIPLIKRRNAEGQWEEIKPIL
ncbi:MAG: hypothetical protein QMD14_02355 [Candidatus Aenigmarchaeota archaeon]|nr:hypothetical protein [Candidatus Aenigmarchaeota archaeon]